MIATASHYDSITTLLRLPSLEARGVHPPADSDLALRLFLGQTYYDRAIDGFLPAANPSGMDEQVRLGMTSAWMTPEAFGKAQQDILHEGYQILRWFNQSYWTGSEHVKHLAITPGLIAVSLVFYRRQGVEVYARVDQQGKVTDAVGCLKRAKDTRSAREILLEQMEAW